MYLLLIACLIQHEGKKIPWSTPLPEALLAGGQLWDFPRQVVYLPKKQKRSLVKVYFVGGSHVQAGAGGHR